MIPQQRASPPRASSPPRLQSPRQPVQGYPLPRAAETADATDVPTIRQLSGRPAALLAGVTAPLVFLLGVVAVQLRPEGSSTAAWWPAAGVAVAAVALVVPSRRVLVLAAVAAGALAANVVAHVTADRSWPVVIGFAAANVVTPWLWVKVMTARRAGAPRLLTVEDFGRFMVATLVATGAAGLVAGVAAAIAGEPMLRTWATFVAVHAASVVILVPFALPQPPSLSRPRAWEVGAQLLAVVCAILVVFTADNSLPLGLLPLPALMWAAARLPTRWVSAELVVVGVLTSLLTTAGEGPYAAIADRGFAPEIVGILLQAALLVYALVSLPLALTVRRQGAALAAAQESYELMPSVLVGATGTAIIGCSRTGTIMFFNTGAEKLLGYSADEVVGRCTPELFHLREEVEARARELAVPPGIGVFTAQVDAGAASERRDWTMVRRDGSTLTMSLRVTARRTDAGQLVGYLALGEDVTERRRTEATLREALKREREALDRLEQLDQAKTTFVSSISHELRTPMTSILGYTDMVLGGAGGPVTKEQKAMLEAARRNGHRLLRLIEDLLTGALIEDGAFTIDTAPLDLRCAVTGALDAVRPMLAERELELHVDAAAPELPVVGDLDQLERVCINLLTNAVKFTPDGGRISVALGTEHDDAFVEVADTGIGVAEEEQPMLFERFFRSSSAREREVPGTGLGLAIVRTIMGSHGGEVTVRSRPGEGTAVRVRLPLHRPAAAGGSAPSDPVGTRSAPLPPGTGGAAARRG